MIPSATGNPNEKHSHQRHLKNAVVLNTCLADINDILKASVSMCVWLETCTSRERMHFTEAAELVICARGFHPDVSFTREVEG